MRECNTTDRVLLGLNSSLVDGYNALYILTVGVLEPLRHRGIGSKLLAAILEQAKERCCLTVFLHVIDYNTAAITFYRRNCFQEIALLHDFYYIGSVACPCAGRYASNNSLCYWLGGFMVRSSITQYEHPSSEQLHLACPKIVCLRSGVAGSGL